MEVLYVETVNKNKWPTQPYECVGEEIYHLSLSGMEPRLFSCPTRSLVIIVAMVSRFTQHSIPQNTTQTYATPHTTGI
jgi:hypothetical protein